MKRVEWTCRSGELSGRVQIIPCHLYLTVMLRLRSAKSAHRLDRGRHSSGLGLEEGFGSSLWSRREVNIVGVTDSETTVVRFVFFAYERIAKSTKVQGRTK